MRRFVCEDRRFCLDVSDFISHCTRRAEQRDGEGQNERVRAAQTWPRKTETTTPEMVNPFNRSCDLEAAAAAAAAAAGPFSRSFNLSATVCHALSAKSERRSYHLKLDSAVLLSKKIVALLGHVPGIAAMGLQHLEPP